MKKQVKLFIGLLLISSFFSAASFGQCKGFTKNYCLPKIDPYVYNGQLNSAVLNEGDIAELLLTFYGGQEYRIVICAEEKLGNLQFKLLDTEHNVIFDNKDQKYTNYWDFNANTTQQLIVEVIVPEDESRSSPVINSGCVSILVGFQEMEED